jgi:hypothetical protein
MVALNQYDEGMVKAVESNFREKDWIFNTSSREWLNDKLGLSFKGQ